MTNAFLLDVMVGKLAVYLRLCGYDTVYALDVGLEADEAIRARAKEENRTLVTRDRELARAAADSVLLESRDIEGQLRELSSVDIDLDVAEQPSYCGRCNGSLRAVPETEQLPEHVPDQIRAVWQCTDCGQQFWKGSHWERMRETIAACCE